MNRARPLAILVTLALLCGTWQPLAAQAPAADPSPEAASPATAPPVAPALDEQVVMVPKGSGLFSVSLETTIFRPAGDGPFPLVIINHGKAPGNPRFQGRYRPMRPVRWFLERGYAVALPMRQGFSKSTGSYVEGGCNIESNGRAQAEDVAAALTYLTAQPWVDAQRVLMVGQSHGGWTTLSFGATPAAAGVKGLVNFAGGLRQTNCPAWEQGLARAAGSLAADTRLPSLWFYGDNDSYFAPPVWQGMHEAYTKAGGNARLVAFGTFAPGDAHNMFGAAEGAPIWQPEVTRFLESLGLPTQARPAGR